MEKKRKKESETECRATCFFPELHHVGLSYITVLSQGASLLLL